MSHHGNVDSPIPDKIKELITNRDERTVDDLGDFNKRLSQLGATGSFPEWKLTENDEGGIQFSIGVKDGKVCLDFGKSVAWIGMNPEDALKLAESLIEKARKAAKGQGSILTLNL